MTAPGLYESRITSHESPREALIKSRVRDRAIWTEGKQVRTRNESGKEQLMHLSVQIARSPCGDAPSLGCARRGACIVALLAKVPTLASSRRLAFIRAWRNARHET